MVVDNALIVDFRQTLLYVIVVVSVHYKTNSTEHRKCAHKSVPSTMT